MRPLVRISCKGYSFSAHDQLSNKLSYLVVGTQPDPLIKNVTCLGSLVFQEAVFPQLRQSENWVFTRLCWTLSIDFRLKGVANSLASEHAVCVLQYVVIKCTPASETWLEYGYLTTETRIVMSNISRKVLCPSKRILVFLPQ